MSDLDAVADCLRSGWLTMGPRTKAFEAAMVQWTSAPHAIAVSSGTAALHLACAALGLGPGDEVIVPAFASPGTLHAPRHVGALPVAADVVSPSAPTLDPEAAARRISSRTRALIVVHPFGFPADVAALRELCTAHGLHLIEDATRALGARLTAAAGTLGCLSFGAVSPLSVGEGGMVVTADEQLAQRVRLLRSHAMTSGTWDRHQGHEDAYDVIDIGFNFRLDEPRAALGLARLPRVAQEIAGRREAVRAYRERFAAVDEFEMMWEGTAVDAASPVACPVLLRSDETRRRIQDALEVHGLRALEEYAAHGTRPNAVAAATRHLALPLAGPAVPAALDAAF